MGHRHLVCGGDAVRGTQGSRAELELLDLVVLERGGCPPAEPLHRFLRDASGRRALRVPLDPSSSDRSRLPNAAELASARWPSARWIIRGGGQGVERFHERMRRVAPAGFVEPQEHHGVLSIGGTLPGERQQPSADPAASTSRLDNASPVRVRWTCVSMNPGTIVVPGVRPHIRVRRVPATHALDVAAVDQDPLAGLRVRERARGRRGRGSSRWGDYRSVEVAGRVFDTGPSDTARCLGSSTTTVFSSCISRPSDAHAALRSSSAAPFPGDRR